MVNDTNIYEEISSSDEETTLNEQFSELLLKLEKDLERLKVDSDEDLSDHFKRKLRDLRVCLVCGPLHRFNKSHARGGHKMRSLNESEKAEEISWYRTIQAEGETARLRILDHRRQE